MRWLCEWVRLLTWGDNWVRRVVNILVQVSIVTSLVGVYIPVQPFLQEKAAIQWKLPGGSPMESGIPNGWLFSIVATLIYGSGTLGAAWVLSRGPVLRMATELQTDSAYGFFRLRFENVGNGEAEPIVKTKRIIYEDGTAAIDEALWGFELEWSHHGVDQRPKLSMGDGGATVGFIWIRDSESIPRYYFPVLCGMRFKPALYSGVPSQDRKPILLEVHATVPGTRQIVTRWFGIEPDESSPLHYSPLSRGQVNRKLSALNLL